MDNKWTKKHSLILNNFFNELNGQCVKYFVLRNYFGLPNVNISKDVDIVIEPGSYKRVSDLLLRIFKENGITNYKIVKYESTRLIYGIDIENNFSIHIDSIEG